jgi:hypothetical protein
MSYDCQKLTADIKDLQQMKQSFDRQFRDGLGSVKNSLGRKYIIGVQTSETKKGLIISESEAKNILGNDFLGSEAIVTVFGSEALPKKIPAIPFSYKELRKARDINNQFLILRTEEAVPNKYGPDAVRWALVSKEPIPSTFNKNYFGQTEELIEYLRTQIFANRVMPEEYKEAISEFEAQKDELRLLSEDYDEKSYKQTAKRLANLEINSLCRQTWDEVRYDLEVYYKTNNHYLLPNNWTWTSSRGASGVLVVAGSDENYGPRSFSDNPSSRNHNLGVVLSRTI